MPLTDYAKWEKMEFDEDDEDDDGGKPRKPRVTKLEGPARITLGAPEPSIAVAARQPPPATTASTAVMPAVMAATNSGKKAAISFDYSKWDHIDSDEELSDDAAADGIDDRYGYDREDQEDDYEDPLDVGEQQRLREVMAAADVVPPPPPPSAAPLDPTARYEALRSALTRNGAARESYLWRQTQGEVELCVLLPPGTRARAVRPELREQDPQAGRRQTLVLNRVGAPANGVSSGVSGVISGGGDSWFVGELAYPVTQPEASDDLTWELTDFEPDGGRRLLHVTFQKEMPNGVTVWWERALQGEAALDTTTLPDRKWADKLAKQQDSWQEAQRMFREKVKNRKKVPIDLGGAQAALGELTGDGAAGGGAGPAGH